MKQVLADISIWAGAIIAVLTILDWVLDNRQKNQLRRFGEDLWLWLAEQKGGKFIHVFTGYKVQLFISVTLWVFFDCPIRAFHRAFEHRPPIFSQRTLFPVTLGDGSSPHLCVCVFGFRRVENSSSGFGLDHARRVSRSLLLGVA
jgi:hypothetical protein